MRTPKTLGNSILELRAATHRGPGAFYLGQLSGFRASRMGGAHRRYAVAVDDYEVGARRKRVHCVGHGSHGRLQDVDLVDGFGADYTPAAAPVPGAQYLYLIRGHDQHPWQVMGSQCLGLGA